MSRSTKASERLRRGHWRELPICSAGRPNWDKVALSARASRREPMPALSKPAILWVGIIAVLAVLIAGAYYMLQAQFH
jgi:hypothetical protein